MVVLLRASVVVAGLAGLAAAIAGCGLVPADDGSRARSAHSPVDTATSPGTANAGDPTEGSPKGSGETRDAGRHTVEFEISGDVERADIRVSDGSGTLHRTHEHLPWTRTLHVDDLDEVTASVVTRGSGAIRCTVVADGRMSVNNSAYRSGGTGRTELSCGPGGSSSVTSGVPADSDWLEDLDPMPDTVTIPAPWLP